MKKPRVTLILLSISVITITSDIIVMAQDFSQIVKKYEEVFQSEIVDLEEEEIESESKIRPCIKTFPWPQNEFIQNKEGEFIASKRMKEINDDISKYVQDYNVLRGPKNYRHLVKFENSRFYKKYEKNLHALFVGFRLEDGMDQKLLRLYSKFLYVRALYAENDFEGIKNELSVSTTKLSRDITILEFDVLEEATYFKEETLNGLLLLHYYYAHAYSFNEDLEKNKEILYRYLSIRKKISPLIFIYGDPLDDLIYNADCEEIFYNY